MRISFSSRKLERQLSDEMQMNQAFGDLARRLKMRLDLLRAANTLADVPHVPPPRRHRLTAPWNGHYAVDLSGNWRLIFKPADHAGGEEANLKEVTAIEIVAVIDYHKK